MWRLFVVTCCACGRLGFDAVPRDGANDGPRTDVADDECAVRDVAAGQAHVCITVAGGATYCAGNNEHGQLGAGTAGGMQAVAVLGGELAGAVSLYAGSEFTCLRDAGGVVRCLGDNGNSQCDGVGSPFELSLVTPAVPVLAHFAPGNSFACGATASDVYCWGDGDEGQGGDGTDVTERAVGIVPSLSGETAVAVGAGVNHICAILASGEVRCWGDARHARLAATAPDICPNASAGSIECAMSPVTAAVPVLAHIAGGGAHTCGLTPAGEVWCWGRNDQGQVGRPVSPQENPAAVPGIPQVTQVVPGSDHTCALDVDGDVWCWGDNSRLQLGSMTSAEAPVRVPLPTTATRVVGHSAADFTCALLDDGAVWCWGENDLGQLGRGTVTQSELPAPLPLPCP